MESESSLTRSHEAVTNLSQVNAAQINPSHLCRPPFIHPIVLVFLVVSFLLAFSQISCTVSPFPVFVPHALLIPPNHSNYTWRKYFFPVHPISVKICTSATCSETPSLTLTGKCPNNAAIQQYSSNNGRKASPAYATGPSCTQFTSSDRYLPQALFKRAGTGPLSK
jgi:hypothetical protein